MDDTREQLFDLDVDIFEAEDGQDLAMAEAMECFSTFVLEDEQEKCRAILDKHLGRSVGELQGGSQDFDIFRVLITHEEESGEDGAAADELLEAFCTSPFGQRYSSLMKSLRNKE